jgi:hypothetical protein
MIPRTRLRPSSTPRIFQYRIRYEDMRYESLAAPLLRYEVVVVISSALCADLRLSRRGESKPILAVHHLKPMHSWKPSRNSSPRSCGCCERRSMPWNGDRALTANEVHDCEQRRKQIHKLNEHLHEFKTGCTSSERDLAHLEVMAREEQEQIKRGLQRTVRIFKQSQSRQ